MSRQVSFKSYYEDHMDWHRYRDLNAHFLYRETRSSYKYNYLSAFAVSLLPRYAAEIKANGGSVRVNSVFVSYIKVPKNVPKPFLYNLME